MLEIPSDWNKNNNNQKADVEASKCPGWQIIAHKVFKSSNDNTH